MLPNALTTAGGICPLWPPQTRHLQLLCPGWAQGLQVVVPRR